MADQAKLYVIPGSHACRTAMLMLERKRVPYRTVELLTGMHGMGVRLHGFPGHRKPIRSVEGKVGPMLGFMDRMGTVPALAIDGRKVQTNREIARHLEQSRPEPSLYPADPVRRRAVEEAAEWGDEQLQMTARRVVLSGGDDGGLDSLHMQGGEGRLGALLSHNDTMRKLTNGSAARLVFGAPGGKSDELRATHRADARQGRRLDRRGSAERRGAEPGRLHDRTQPGAPDLLPGHASRAGQTSAPRPHRAAAAGARRRLS